MGYFKNYIENKNCEDEKDLEPKAKEAIREIQVVVNKTLDNSKKVNGFGINEMKFEIISQECAEAGIQINMEAKGSAIAKNEKHISRMLQHMVSESREDLWKKDIFLEVMYHQIETSESKLDEAEDDDSNVGLKRTLYFTVICAAIVFN